MAQQHLMNASRRFKQSSCRLAQYLYSNGQPVIDLATFRKDFAADSNWSKVSQTQAQEGDIYIEGDGYPGPGQGAGQQHIGICEDSGCKDIISNSSGSGSFTWDDTSAAYQNYWVSHGYANYPPGFWHHK